MFKNIASALKSAFCILMLLVAFQSESAGQAVGILKDKMPVLTESKKNLCSNLSQNLSISAGIKETFVTVKLVATNEGYMLIFTGKSHITKIAVKQDGADEEGNPVLVAIGNTACTVEGITAPETCCAPIKEACSDCKNNAKCVKTTIVGSLIAALR